MCTICHLIIVTVKMSWLFWTEGGKKQCACFLFVRIQHTLFMQWFYLTDKQIFTHNLDTDFASKSFGKT